MALEPQNSDVVAAVWERSKLNRSLLKPDYLPSVERRKTADVVEAAKAYMATGGVIAIHGEAGNGKTVMLGQVFDGLESSSWCAVVLASILSEKLGSAVQQIDQALGSALCLGVPISSISSAMIQARGPGVFIFDTLDLIISRDTKQALYTVLSELVVKGNVVIFTSRTREYQQFFDRLPWGFGAKVHATTVVELSGFDAGEQHEATLGFFLKSHPTRSIGEAEAFAKSLAKISAHSQPLADIIESPLRLGMLCRVFDHGQVPADLTVALLYERYWDRQVNPGDRGGPSAGDLRERICMKFASIAFRSESDLRLTVTRDDLLGTDVALGASVDELLSAAVLRHRGGGVLEFFHQTFLEYVIARYMLTAQGQAKLESFLTHLEDTDPNGLPPYLWPILRQVLTICSPQAFLAYVGRAKLSEPLHLRSVAGGACARFDGEGVLELTRRYGELSDHGQRYVLECLPSVGKSIWAKSFELFCMLAANGHTGARDRACSLADRILSRSPTPSQHLELLLMSLDKADDPPPRLKEKVVKRAHRLGFVLAAVQGQMLRSKDLETFKVLLHRYRQFRAGSCAVLVHILVQDWIPEELRKAWLEQEISCSLESQLVKEGRWDLAAILTRWFLPGSGPADGWIAALQGSCPEGWGRVRCAALALRAQKDESLASSLFSTMLSCPPDLANKIVTVLADFAEIGGSPVICRLLGTVDIELLPEERRRWLLRVIEAAAQQGSPEAVEHINKWLNLHVAKVGIKAFRIPALRGLPVVQLIEELKSGRKLAIGVEELFSHAGAIDVRHIEEIVPVLEQVARVSKNSGAYCNLVAAHAIIAHEKREFADLIRDALSQRPGPAKLAAKSLELLCRQGIVTDPCAVLEVMQSGIAGVREKAVDCWIALSQQGIVIEGDLVFDLWRRVLGNPFSNLVQRYLHFISIWTRSRQTCSSADVDEIVLVFDRALGKYPFDAGVFDKAVMVIHQCLRFAEHPSASESLQWARLAVQAASESDLHIDVDHLMTLLCTLEKLSPGLLMNLISEALPLIPLVSQAVGLAAIQVSGEAGDLLRKLSGMPWITEEALHRLPVLDG